MQHGAVLRRHRHRQHTARKSLRYSGGFALPIADRAATESIHLQRALDALRIGWVDADRSDGIHDRKLGMHRGPAAFKGFRRKLCARRRIRLGHRRQALQQRAEIQAGAAGEDRQISARDDVVDRCARVLGELGGRIRLPRFAHIDQMVRNGCKFFSRGLGRTDIEPAIHQRRIDADDFTAEALRPVQRECGLARCGRTHQGDGE